MSAQSSAKPEVDLPIIDLTDLSDSNSRKLVDEVRKHGFLVLKNHFLDKADIDELFCISKQFFEKSDEYKNQFPITPENDGYVAPYVEDLQQDGTGNGDNKEAFNLTHFSLSNFTPNQPLPDIFTNNMTFISACLRKYYVTLHLVCRMLAVGLEVKDKDGYPNPDFFVKAHSLDKETHSALRFLHYSQLGEEFKDVNLAGAHTDYGSVTFVVQRPQTGLQIYNGNEWLDVTLREQHNDDDDNDDNELMIVHIGDILSFWTDGYIKSTLHRVRSVNERDSVVFFCHPSDQSLLEPVNSSKIKKFQGKSFCLDQNGNPLTALEHLKSKLREGYNRKN